MSHMGMQVACGVLVAAMGALTPGTAAASEVPTLTRHEARSAVAFAWPSLVQLPSGADLGRCPRPDVRLNVRVCRTGTAAQVVVRETRDGDGYLVTVR